MRTLPQHAPCRGVERHDGIRRFDGEQNAVHYQRCRLELFL
jgi:hypothetical protein